MDNVGLEWTSLETRFGRYLVGAGASGIVSAGFGLKRMPGQRGPSRFEGVLDRARRELEEYMAGKRRRFTVKVDLSSGTDFQQRVWSRMMDIPFGKVMTYGELAKAVGRAGASRAVGQACRSNPIGVIVPCHRVVSSTGIGGFGGPKRALDMKRALLFFEGVEY